jgi:hypothetical protein
VRWPGSLMFRSASAFSFQFGTLCHSDAFLGACRSFFEVGASIFESWLRDGRKENVPAKPEQALIVKSWMPTRHNYLACNFCCYKVVL